MGQFEMQIYRSHRTTRPTIGPSGLRAMLVAVLGSIAMLGCASAPKTTVSGDTYLTRSVTESKEGITVTTGEAVLAMVTSDIERVHARVQELGATVLFGPQQSVSGTESELVFYDLDGIRVHVVERNE